MQLLVCLKTVTFKYARVPCLSKLLFLQESLIHSSNSLAIKALQSGNKHLSFVRSCIAFSEVTLPSISVLIRQMNLYLETAEVSSYSFGGVMSVKLMVWPNKLRCILIFLHINISGCFIWWFTSSFRGFDKFSS